MKTKLIKREPYSKLLEETVEPIKIITGVRRAGKSTLLTMLSDRLRASGITEDQIVRINLESLKFNTWSKDDLYSYLIEQSRKVNGKKLYILLDEIQMITDWENVVNRISSELDCELFLTGSNANLNTAKLAASLLDQTEFIEILPFSFREFLTLKGFRIKEKINKYPSERFIILDKENQQVNSKLLLDEYLKFGGFSETYDFLGDLNKLIHLNEIRDTFFLRDIIQARQHSQDSSISNTLLIDNLYNFILQNIGKITSTNKTTNYLNSHKFLNNHYHNQTVLSYLKALEKSFLIYKVRRFDLREKRILSKLDKYYSVDPGLRYAVLEDVKTNRGYILENIVFLELKRRGFEIFIGKNNNLEIDFYARKNGKNYFIQVTESLENQEVMKREVKPLKNIKDFGRKIILTNQNSYQGNIDDIEVINIIDFLLDFNDVNEN